jgi:hypothetical protein
MKIFANTNLLLLFALLLSHYVIGQNQPADDERTKKIKMPKFFKAALPPKSIPVTDIRIVQAIPDSNRLGYLQKGMANQKVIAVPSKPLTVYLQEYVTKQYKDGFAKEGNQLLIVVKELRVNERTFFSTEKGFVRFQADAYLSKDKSSYQFAAAIDTVLVNSSVMDVTSSHGENIAAAIYILIKQSLQNGESVLNNTASLLTNEQILAKQLDRFQLPILTDSGYIDGAYASFQEFLQDRPSVLAFEVESVDKKGKVRIMAVQADGTKKEITPWGICKGGELYKYYENDLVPIEQVGHYFIISDYLEKINRRNSGIFAAALFGGALGAGIASSTSQKLYSVTQYPYITKKQPEACAIDLVTGEFTF